MGWSDADWGADPDTRCSVSGYAFSLGWMLSFVVVEEAGNSGDLIDGGRMSHSRVRREKRSGCKCCSKSSDSSRRT